MGPNLAGGVALVKRPTIRPALARIFASYLVIGILSFVCHLNLPRPCLLICHLDFELDLIFELCHLSLLPLSPAYCLLSPVYCSQ